MAVYDVRFNNHFSLNIIVVNIKLQNSSPEFYIYINCHSILKSSISSHLSLPSSIVNRRIEESANNPLESFAFLAATFGSINFFCLFDESEFLLIISIN